MSGPAGATAGREMQGQANRERWVPGKGGIHGAKHPASPSWFSAQTGICITHISLLMAVFNSYNEPTQNKMYVQVQVHPLSVLITQRQPKREGQEHSAAFPLSPRRLSLLGPGWIQPSSTQALAPRASPQGPDTANSAARRNTRAAGSWLAHRSPVQDSLL